MYNPFASNESNDPGAPGPSSPASPTQWNAVPPQMSGASAGMALSPAYFSGPRGDDRSTGQIVDEGAAEVMQARKGAAAGKKLANALFRKQPGQDTSPQKMPPPPGHVPMTPVRTAVIPGGWENHSRSRQHLDVDPKLAEAANAAIHESAEAKKSAAEAGFVADAVTREYARAGAQIRMGVENEFREAELQRQQRTQAEVAKAAKMVDQIAAQPTNQWAGVNPAAAIALIAIDGLQRHFGSKQGGVGDAKILDKFLQARVDEQKRRSINLRAATDGQFRVIDNIRKMGYDERTADAMYKGALLTSIGTELEYRASVARDPAKIQQIKAQQAMIDEAAKRTSLEVAKGVADKVNTVEKYRPTRVVSVGGAPGGARKKFSAKEMQKRQDRASQVRNMADFLVAIKDRKAAAVDTSLWYNQEQIRQEKVGVWGATAPFVPSGSDPDKAIAARAGAGVLIKQRAKLLEGGRMTDKDMVPAAADFGATVDDQGRVVAIDSTRATAAGRALFSKAYRDAMMVGDTEGAQDVLEHARRAGIGVK